ncbi:22112_t:CDS:1, partial [Gigaspora margarita]
VVVEWNRCRNWSGIVELILNRYWPLLIFLDLFGALWETGPRK